jgi:phage tail protein X
MAATTLRAVQGDTVDAICWRHYGRTAGVTEAVLEANPGLADHGPVIPQGTSVTMPAQAPIANDRKTVNLWD